MSSDDTHTTETDGESNGETSRRRFLRGSVAAGTAAIGLGSASVAASAQWFGGGGPTVVDVSDDSGSWSASESLPVADEVLVFIHGWFGNSTASGQTSSVEDALDGGGYTADETIAVRWPATTIDAAGVQADTENVGEVTAGLAEEFYDAGGGNLRLVGHSLGGRCVYWTMTKLATGYEIETVAGLGTAANGSEICGDPWNDGLDNACAVRNYHSGNDGVIAGYGTVGNALGADGAGCDPAPNYADVDVTDSVGNHLGYLGSSAVGDHLAGVIAEGGCGGGGSGGSGGSGTSGGSGGWWGSGGSGSGGSGSESGSGSSGGSGDDGSGWW